MSALLAVYLLTSTIAFAAYALDKGAAARGAWRLPETFLHLLSLLGGWPGALCARRIFRHKTRKVSFRIAFWLTVFLNISVLLLIVRR